MGFSETLPRYCFINENEQKKNSSIEVVDSIPLKVID